LIAAAEAEVDLEYCAFSEARVTQPLRDIHALIINKNITCGELLQFICSRPTLDLFGKITQHFDPEFY